MPETPKSRAVTCGIGTLILALQRIRPLNCNVDVLKFIEGINGVGFIDVYVEHYVDNPDIIDVTKLSHGYDKEVDIDEGVDKYYDKEIDIDKRFFIKRNDP